MPKKRSRRDTEARFQEAVLELVAASGCGALGINQVADQTGADKVLIYRYFGGLDGLLESVATSRTWAPPWPKLEAGAVAAQLLRELRSDAVRALRGDSVARQLLRWRHAVANPLTQAFNRDWDAHWDKLGRELGTGLSAEAGREWRRAARLLGLVVEAEALDQPVERTLLDGIALEDPHLSPPENAPETTGEPTTGFYEESLPTNLL